ncbi:hypothetical protein RCI24_20345 [Enterobacter hormaechei]|uniref:hypothetical protein n=1 Tax=Enterobacter hormaechei TaxID=158836 RepID=UPI002A75458C|nr:hypothetical protein [Enterobacter hormaechei]MDY3567793.1 hypothetical protein [Enterobacter hormaechei]
MPRGTAVKFNYIGHLRLEGKTYAAVKKQKGADYQCPIARKLTLSISMSGITRMVVKNSALTAMPTYDRLQEVG